ncbi:MAG: Gfo/Idh/MocA family oxidoreductase [Rhodospirillales bacterium]
MTGPGQRPLRVVLAGSGYVTPFHIRGWQALADIEVVAIAARNETVAKQRAREFGIARTYSNLAAALAAEQPDIVDICTPPEAHAEQIGLAARYGAQVICQKPLAASLSEARAMLATVEAAGIRAMVHENFRFRPWFRALGQRLRAGDIGQPFYLRSDLRLAGTVTTSAHPQTAWSLARQPFFAGLDRFLVLESVIHQIDVARYLLGEPQTIYARTRRISSHVAGEDLAILHLGFEAAEAVIERSYASKGYSSPPVTSETVVVEGDEGTAFVDRDGGLRIVRDGPGGSSDNVIALDRADAYAGSYAATIAHFVDGLRSGAPFETDFRDNLRTLAITLAAYDSVETGQPVDLHSLFSAL